MLGLMINTHDNVLAAAVAAIFTGFVISMTIYVWWKCLPREDEK